MMTYLAPLHDSTLADFNNKTYPYLVIIGDPSLVLLGIRLKPNVQYARPQQEVVLWL